MTDNIIKLANEKRACAGGISWANENAGLDTPHFLETLGEHNPSWLAWLLVNVPEAREHMTLKSALRYDSGEWQGQIKRVYQ